MKALDTLTFPLSGAALIEASAGTGKTYTIVNLFLRLLLGHQCRPHALAEILVVTFTNAATAELRHRIRLRLQDAQRALLSGQSQDPFLLTLLETLEDRQDAQLRLALAIREMDSASVFTIHGFSQRMLAEFAFESGQAYEQTLILDESQLRQHAVEDYWRRHLVDLDPGMLMLVQQVWSGPQNMLHSIAPFLSRDVQLGQAPGLAQLDQLYASYRALLESVRHWWLGENIEQRLLDAKLKRTVKAGKPAHYAAMTAWCHASQLLPPFGKDGWALLGEASIAKALSKQSGNLDCQPFARFDQLHDALMSLQRTLVAAFSADALTQVRRYLAAHKQRLQLLAPDDLLAQLRGALHSAQGEDLARAIAARFPVALIDEFQDTDPAQFDIFQQIYAQPCGQQSACWIMIGDPKQAIYAFRGADIFTYIQAKRWVSQENHFTLATNWRSRADLVAAVNGFFARSAQGFLYEQDIPFIEVKAARDNTVVTAGGRGLPVLNLDWFRDPEDLPVSWTVAQQSMALRCAQHIATCLFSDGKIGDRAVKPADCCVLVRDRNEAEIIKQALAKQGVRSVFLARHSVFATDICAELYLLLHALAHPGDDRAIRAALATTLFGYDAFQLDQLYNDEMAWQSLVEQCYGWHRLWQQKGVMAACYSVAHHFGLFEKQMCSFADGMRRITDIRHLIELLQQQSRAFQSESQLLQWLAESMADPDHNSDTQQMRLESDQDLVQIVTMHASKGLEYSLVFMPFAARHRATSQSIYHDSEGRLQVDFTQREDTLEKADFERLAEDIRLLYVAMTRAVYHCWVGVWNAAHSTRKKQSVFAQSALGRVLLGPVEAVDNAAIFRALTAFGGQHAIDVSVFEQVPEDASNLIARTPHTEPVLHMAALANPVPRDWFVTSYSALSRHGHADIESTPGRDESPERDVPTGRPDTLSVYSFDRGAQAGSFLHGVLENITFNHPVELAQVIESQGSWYGISDHWYPLIEQWIKDVLCCPIVWHPNEPATPLGQMYSEHLVVEMEFFLPLNRVTESAFNNLLQKHASEWYRPYQFGKLHGMLKGFIDLTAEVNGRFYVVDYKSNHLGHDAASYQQGALHQAMIGHDYYLQALLYVVAVQRYLRTRIPDYNYDIHLGGAVYLFLRGMSAIRSDTGVIHYRPKKTLVDALDALFAGKSLGHPPGDTPVQGVLPL